MVSDRIKSGLTDCVRLISISKPVIPDVPGPAELLAFCARVSSTANQLNHTSGGKLIRSLITRQEWSPLEMVSLTIEIGPIPRDIARQILRHWSIRPQEFSQRYAIVIDEPIYREARLQDYKDRQNSLPNNSHIRAAFWAAGQRIVWFAANSIYRLALYSGIAKEVARAVLPEGLTPTRLYMAGTLRSWVHYIQLRIDRKTQKEHRAIAERCQAIIFEQFPDIAEALQNQT